MQYAGQPVNNNNMMVQPQPKTQAEEERILYNKKIQDLKIYIPHLEKLERSKCCRPFHPSLPFFFLK